VQDTAAIIDGEIRSGEKLATWMLRAVFGNEDVRWTVGISNNRVARLLRLEKLLDIFQIRLGESSINEVTGIERRECTNLVRKELD
jgi:hypothetical protein